MPGMTAAVYLSSFSGSRDAARRLAWAVGWSAAAHLLLVESLALETTLRADRGAAPTVLTARIEPPADSEPDGLRVPAPKLAATGVHAQGIGRAQARIREKRDSGTSLALPQAPDPTYYSARDLDFYPQPAAPLQLDAFTRGGGSAATIFRFHVLIDESGVVDEVSPVEGEPSSLREELRAMLAATRFFPGRKDGRAVKSRVMLGIDVNAGRRDSPGR